MAQSKSKRRRKHRGTQAGTVERAGRPGGSRSRQDPKQAARERRAARLDQPPTWRSAVNRAAIAALIFGVLTVVLFGQEVTQAIYLTALVFVIYIPLGYATDSAIHRFRMRRKARG